MGKIILFFLFCAPFLLFAQPDKDQRFAFAGYLGFNLSQIDGDYYFGYNQPGVRFGIETQYLARPKYFFSVGLGYAQTGSRPNRAERNERGNNTVALRLNTIEIPLLFNYRLGKKTDVGRKQNYQLFRGATIQVGLVVSRITGLSVRTSGRAERLPRKFNFTSVKPEYEEFDLKAIAGVTVGLGLKTAFFLQHNKSILGLYRPGNVGLEEVLPLYPYSLSMGLRVVVY